MRRLLGPWVTNPAISGGIPAPLDAWTGNAPVFGIGTRALSKAKYSSSAGTLLRSSGATQAFSFGADGELDLVSIGVFLNAPGSNGKGSWTAVTDQVGGLTVGQSTDAYRPGFRTNLLGVPVLSFAPGEQANSVTAGTKSLSITSGPTIGTSTNSVVYVVQGTRAYYSGGFIPTGFLNFSAGSAALWDANFGVGSTNPTSVSYWYGYGGNHTTVTQAPANMGLSCYAFRFNATDSAIYVDGRKESFGAFAQNGTLTNLGWILDNASYYSQGPEIIALIVAQGHSESDVTANLAALRAWASLAPQPTTMFGVIGDSISSGYQTSTSHDNTEMSWPWKMLDSIGRGSVKHVRAINRARTGYTIANAESIRPYALAPMLTRYPNAGTGAADFSKKVLTVCLGTNDINNGRTGTQAITDLTTFIGACKSDGWSKVIACTQIPRQSFTGTQNTYLTALNAAITGGSVGADGFIDFASLNWVPGGTDWAANFQGDGTHPNSTGTDMMAALAMATLQSLI